MGLNGSDNNAPLTVCTNSFVATSLSASDAPDVMSLIPLNLSIAAKTTIVCFIKFKTLFITLAKPVQMAVRVDTTDSVFANL